MSRPSRRGFTLIELLVVSGAITLLGTQLVEAIAQAREAARRSQCKNNLRQLGLAIHNYEATHRCLPPGWVGADSKPSQPNVHGLNGWSWCAFLSPFLDQTQLYKSINFSVSVADPKNAAIVARVWLGSSPQSSSLRCPTDPFSKKTWTLKDANGEKVAELATSNYVGSFGSSDFSKVEKMEPGEVGAGDGILFHNSRVQFADVKDGTSNTLAIGERMIEEKADRFATWSGVFAKGKHPFSRILGTSNQPMNAKEKNSSDFGSAHQGGTQFALLDGSVRFIELDIDLRVLKALTTRDGAEEVGDF